jgi:hypothetical protein
MKNGKPSSRGDLKSGFKIINYGSYLLEKLTKFAKNLWIIIGVDWNGFYEMLPI